MRLLKSKHCIAKHYFTFLGLRLLGIGRNEYIELMNQCRSGKKLFRRKSICKNLLPTKPVNIHMEPWWIVEIIFITDEDIKVSWIWPEEKID